MKRKANRGLNKAFGGEVLRVFGKAWRFLGRCFVPNKLRHHSRWREEQLGQVIPFGEFLRLRLLLVRKASPLSWIKSSDLSHPVAVRIDTSDEYVYEQIFLEKEYDVDVPEPSTIIDAGANIGLASVWFANRFPKARIVAIEPDPANFAVLKQNASSYPQIQCLQVGLWHRSAMLQRIQEDAQPWAYRYEESGEDSGSEAMAIESIGLDELIDQYLGRRLDLLKMDIEGAEKEILAVGGAWVSQLQSAMIETHERWVPGCDAAMMGRFPVEIFEEHRSGENAVFVRRSALKAEVVERDETSASKNGKPSL